MTADEESRIDWSLCTWKGSRLQQHRKFRALPFRRKLEIIEELADHGRRTLEWRKSRGLPYIDPATGQAVKPTRMSKLEASLHCKVQKFSRAAKVFPFATRRGF